MRSTIGIETISKQRDIREDWTLELDIVTSDVLDTVEAAELITSVADSIQSIMFKNVRLGLSNVVRCIPNELTIEVDANGKVTGSISVAVQLRIIRS